MALADDNHFDLPQHLPFVRLLPRVIVLTFFLGLFLLSTGCMHRRMTIQSDPPGALVMLDGEEIGYTPVSHDFTYYGTREITLIKDGYETLTSLQKISPPWYQRVPLDFVSDNFWPMKTTDRRNLSFPLQPQVVVPTNDLLDRANSLRSESQLGQ